MRSITEINEEKRWAIEACQRKKKRMGFNFFKSLRSFEADCAMEVGGLYAEELAAAQAAQYEVNQEIDNAFINNANGQLSQDTWKILIGVALFVLIVLWLI